MAKAVVTRVFERAGALVLQATLGLAVAGVWPSPVRGQDDTADTEVPLPPDIQPPECTDLAPEDKLACPLLDRVVRIEDTRSGARLHLRSRSIPAEKLRLVLACQRAEAAVTPAQRIACPFLAGGATWSVIRRDGRVLLDVSAGPGESPEVLRQEIRNAFPEVGRPRGR